MTLLIEDDCQSVAAIVVYSAVAITVALYVRIDQSERLGAGVILYGVGISRVESLYVITCDIVIVTARHLHATNLDAVILCANIIDHWELTTDN